MGMKPRAIFAEPCQFCGVSTKMNDILAELMVCRDHVDVLCKLRIAIDALIELGGYLPSERETELRKKIANAALAKISNSLSVEFAESA